MDNLKEPIIQREILEAILHDLPRTDAPVNSTVQGTHLVAADCGGRSLTPPAAARPEIFPALP